MENDIRKRFKDTNNILGITNEQTARVIGVKPSTYSKWIHEHRTPSGMTIKFFNVLEWLHKKGILYIFMSDIDSRDDLTTMEKRFFYLLEWVNNRRIIDDCIEEVLKNEKA